MKSNESKTSETTSRASAHFKPKTRGTSYQTIQPKLTVNQPNDVYEQEAERLADQVMSQSQTITELRKTEGVDPLATPVQRRDNSSLGIQLEDDNFEEELILSKGRGKPLSDGVRTSMEQHFGEDFSNVKIHENSKANELNQMVSAHAFTHNQDIYFSAGKYNPESGEGKRLLAHELTHVVQQTGGETNKQASSAANHSETNTGSQEASQSGTTLNTVQSNPIQREEDDSWFSKIGNILSGPADVLGGSGILGPLGGLGKAFGGAGAMGEGLEKGDPLSVAGGFMGFGSGALDVAKELGGDTLGKGALNGLGAGANFLGLGQSATKAYSGFTSGDYVEGGSNAVKGLGQGLSGLGALGGFELASVGGMEAGAALTGAGAESALGALGPAGAVIGAGMAGWEAGKLLERHTPVGTHTQETMGGLDAMLTGEGERPWALAKSEAMSDNWDQGNYLSSIGNGAQLAGFATLGALGGIGGGIVDAAEWLNPFD